MLEALLNGRGGAATDSWSLVDDISPGRRAAAGTVLGEWLYIHGGAIDGGTRIDSFLRYNLETGEVETLVTGPAARMSSAMAAVNGLIYLYGGYSNLKDFWQYDPVTNTWLRLPDGPSIRETHTMTEVEGKLYVVGGESSTDALGKIVLCYDPVAGTWTSLASMSQVRYGATVVAIGTKLYLHAGWAASNTYILWCYDIPTNTWSVLKPNTGTGNTRRDHGAGVVDGKMYIHGGDSQTTNDVWMYNPESDTWTKRKPHVPRINAGVSVVYKGKIYAYGGNATPMASALWAYTP